jgi:hypothetical protein
MMAIVRGRLIVLWALSIGVAPSAAAAGGEPAPVECRDYASNLESCSPYTCTFTHPITGATLERTIVGLTAGICSTREAMPGKRMLRCEFPGEARKQVAAFFRQIEAARGGNVVGAMTATPGGTTTSTTTIDGRPVANPLQQALENGVCKIGS